MQIKMDFFDEKYRKISDNNRQSPQERAELTLLKGDVLLRGSDVPRTEHGLCGTSQSTRPVGMHEPHPH